MTCDRCGRQREHLLNRVCDTCREAESARRSQEEYERRVRQIITFRSSCGSCDGRTGLRVVPESLEPGRTPEIECVYCMQRAAAKAARSATPKGVA